MKKKRKNSCAIYADGRSSIKHSLALNFKLLWGIDAMIGRYSSTFDVYSSQTWTKLQRTPKNVIRQTKICSNKFQVFSALTRNSIRATCSQLSVDQWIKKKHTHTQANSIYVRICRPVNTVNFNCRSGFFWFFLYVWTLLCATSIYLYFYCCMLSTCSM